MFEPRVILVTGGAGFIGSALVRRIVRHTDATIINVDKLTYAGNLDSLAETYEHPRHQFVQADIADRDAIRRTFLEYAPDAVVHLAAESHVDRSIDAPEAFVQTNVLGTAVLLDEALRYWRTARNGDPHAFRFLHVSTDEVFGSLTSEGTFTETSPYAPNSPYAASKAGSDHLVRAWHHTYGFPSVISNCSNNYGPYQFPEKLIPLTIQNALAGKPLPVYGQGANIRDWLFVEDHAAALLQILTRGRVGESYAIGGRAERTNLHVVQQICETIDALLETTVPRNRLITFVQDRPGHDFRYAIDPSKMEREIGWTPAHTFEDGLRETVQWYIENQPWCERVQSGAYRGERLGLGSAA